MKALKICGRRSIHSNDRLKSIRFEIKSQSLQHFQFHTLYDMVLCEHAGRLQSLFSELMLPKTFFPIDT
jgi:hypothetical protein